MTFASLLEEYRDQRHQVTVYRSGEPPALETWLADHGVAVESRSLPPGGPDPFIEIRTGGEFVGIVGVEAVEGLFEPPIRRPGERPGIAAGYRTLFEILDRTVFSAMTRRELLAVSREIEDRAYRVGEGTLWVSFQTLSIFRTQADVYRTLATNTDLSIHVFGADDWTPPEIDGVEFHADAAARFERYWVLAYDGGPDETQASGLLAEERADEYTGFWTNDPGTVDRLATTLATTSHSDAA